MFKSANITSSNEPTTLPSQRYNLLELRHRLSFFDVPPLYDVTLEQFETTALNRLRILAEIESSAVRCRSWDETKAVTTAQCSKYLPLGSNSSIPYSQYSSKIAELDSQRRSDILSHFVLRLAFCRSEELRRRFVKAETTLFKIRFETDDKSEQDAFLKSRNFNWIPVENNEKDFYKSQLLSFYSLKDKDAFETDKYFKVPWRRVIELVNKRRVFLHGGFAFVPSREQASIVYHEFESALNLELEKTSRALPPLEEDNRLVPILNNLSQGFLAGVPTQWTNDPNSDKTHAISAEMIDDLAKKHWPACMRGLHNNLRRDHHLKHAGRLTYGLFLKGVGLKLDEAIVFWRKSFEGKIDGDKFNKEYKYNVRHSYGEEGKRANYPPKSCIQVITGDPSHPGCPFKQASDDNLQTILLSHYTAQGLKSSDLPEVLNMVKSGSYHVACTRVFEITHGVPKGQGTGEGETVTHPNTYAGLSIEIEERETKKESNEMDLDLDSAT